MILNCYIDINDLYGAGVYAKYIETLLVEYESCEMVYRLYYALFLYHSKSYHFAEAYEYAKKTRIGLNYDKILKISK